MQGQILGKSEIQRSMTTQPIGRTFGTVPALFGGQKSLYEKLRILSDAAKYDVACTSSGTSRRGMKTESGAARKQGSVTVFLRMGDVSHF